jgi:hypothetical protein
MPFTALFIASFRSLRTRPERPHRPVHGQHKTPSLTYLIASALSLRLLSVFCLLSWPGLDRLFVLGGAHFVFGGVRGIAVRFLDSRGDDTASPRRAIDCRPRGEPPPTSDSVPLALSLG